ncbi:hypothetical protein TU79_10910 [Pseudomonas trivialis]|uniref:Uncharacterized protein n=1 Tax=Pseudomonas trivialis TaxID=200450 RepID=A0A0R2ZPF6_9PSED|nr:hypothetical protein TU79_10910 [Pseudomonas trivialis]
MHCWKKISLTEDLERSLPGHQVDCVLINGWTATIFVRQPELGSMFCTTGIDLAKLANSESVHELAEELVFEIDMSRGGKAG